MAMVEMRTSLSNIIGNAIEDGQIPHLELAGVVASAWNTCWNYVNWWCQKCRTLCS